MGSIGVGIIDEEQLERKLKKVCLSPELLVEFFRQGKHVPYEMLKGIPLTARFSGIAIEPEKNIIHLFIYDESFNPVPAYEFIPNLDCVVKQGDLQ